jgi:hypothetical protein
MILPAFAKKGKFEDGVRYMVDGQEKESTKFQASMNKLPKQREETVIALVWVIGIWSLEFIWNLVLVIWNFRPLTSGAQACQKERRMIFKLRSFPCIRRRRRASGRRFPAG